MGLEDARKKGQLTSSFYQNSFIYLYSLPHMYKEGKAIVRLSPVDEARLIAVPLRRPIIINNAKRLP
jgi:hypothetical protein